MELGAAWSKSSISLEDPREARARSCYGSRILFQSPRKCLRETIQFPEISLQYIPVN